MKIPIITALLVSLLTLLGCVYVPPVWDIGDAINDVGWIEPGVTTKEQVIERLGDPDSIDGEQIIYRGDTSYGAVVTYGAGGMIGEKLWSIHMDLDEAGIVRKVTKLENESPEERANQLEVEAANRGDPKAQFNLFKRTAPGNQAWLWLCRSANSGYGEAQSELGSHYENGEEPAPKDHVEAYKWYTLAHASGYSYANVQRNRLFKTMTFEQTRRAELLITEWKPDPGSCDVNGRAAS